MKNNIRISQSEFTAKEILDHYFGNFRKIDNFRPEWLGGLEIDRYYPTLGVAIEFQGDQHSRTVPGMHTGPEDFQRQVENDRKKRQLLESRGIKLHDISLLQLDRMRVVGFAKKIADDGKGYLEKNKDKAGLYSLSRIRFDEPSDFLLKKVDRLSHVKKTYYKPVKNKSIWKKIFG